MDFFILMIDDQLSESSAAIHHDQIRLYPILGCFECWSRLYAPVEIVRKFGLESDLKQLDAMIYDADHDGKHIGSCKISISHWKYFIWLWIFSGTNNIELEDFLQLVESLREPMDDMKPGLDSLVSVHRFRIASRDRRTFPLYLFSSNNYTEKKNVF